MWDSALQSLLCWAASFPSLQHFLRSWLCVLVLSEIEFHLAPTSTPHLCASVFRFLACEVCVQWLLRQWPAPVSLWNPGLPLLLTLPVLLRTVLPLRCFLQWLSVFACMPSVCASPTSALLHLTTFESLCIQPSPSLWTLSAPQSSLHTRTVVPTVSHVSNTWQASSTLQGSVDWDSTFFGTARSQWMLCLPDLDWGTSIWRLVTCICGADPGSTVLILPLPSHRVLPASAQSGHAGVRDPSRVRQRVWDHVGTRFLSLPSATCCSKFWCSLTTRNWWPSLWLDTHSSSSSQLPSFSLLALWARSHHHVSTLILDLPCNETNSSSWAPIEIPNSGRDLASHAPSYWLHPLFRTCSSSSVPLIQRRRPFCPPLAAVSTQVSGLLRGSTHVTRQCAWLRTCPRCSAYSWIGFDTILSRFWYCRVIQSYTRRDTTIR